MKGRHLSLPPAAAGLSARLLVLTVAFVMLAEVLIYAPSIGRFRSVYLQERLADAHLAILALEATPETLRHFEQWHMPISVVLPVISNETAPHRQDPETVSVMK